MMGSDPWARWLLVAVLAGVAFLVALELFPGERGRFTVTALRPGVPVLVRTDTTTGQSWLLELRAGGGRWEPLPEPGTPEWNEALNAYAARPVPAESEALTPRPLARDEIKSLANAILGDELSPEIRFWAVGQLAATEHRRATLALIQLLDEVDDPRLVALIREALTQRDDPRARLALERHATGRAGDR